MTMSIEEISDRLEIQDLFVRYTYALDTQDWDAFDSIFTPDAQIDYTAMGGSVGDLAATMKFLRETMVMFPSYQHMTSSSTIKVTGDTAEAKTICHNPMVLRRTTTPRSCSAASGTSTSWCAPPTAGASRSGSRRRAT